MPWSRRRPTCPSSATRRVPRALLSASAWKRNYIAGASRHCGGCATTNKLANREQLHFEHQSRIRRYDAARAARAVAELRRNGELAFAADFHAAHAFVPAADHFAAAEREHERLAAIFARVELLAVGEPAGVVHAHALPGRRTVAVAHH